MAQTVTGLVSKPYLSGRGEIGVGSTLVVCEYEDVFPEELPGLPPHRDVDFVIELHPDPLPISMTLNIMVPAELQELSNYRNCWTEVLLDRALHLGALQFCLIRKRIRPFGFA